MVFLIGLTGQRVGRTAVFLPDRIRPGTRFYLLSWGRVVHGELLTLDLGTITDDRLVSATNTVYKIVPNGVDRTFDTNVFLSYQSGYNCLPFGQGNGWTGLLQFILFDASRLVAYDKLNELYQGR